MSLRSRPGSQSERSVVKELVQERKTCEVEGEKYICSTIGCHSKASLSVPGEHMVLPDARVERSIVCACLSRLHQTRAIVEFLPSR